MFFTASKILWAVFTPLTFIAVLMLAGIGLGLLNCFRLGKVFVTAGIFLFLILGFFPVGPNLVVFLEKEYAVPDPLPDKVDGIIILGGALNAERTRLHDQASLNDYSERITEGIRLSRIYPQARIVYSGGTGDLDQDSGREAEEIHKLLTGMGISTERFLFETMSRNTYENMRYSFLKIHPQPGENWLLVTSAFHMPRSMAIFTNGGWEVIPYPAGYLEDGTYKVTPSLDVLGNFYKLQVASKEIVGIIAYSLTGKL